MLQRSTNGLSHVLVLSGAGVSAESGLGTFRDPDGLWAKFDPYELATPEAFTRQPETVHAFYNMRRRALLDAKPNAAHEALARLERAMNQAGGRLTLVTQNVDNLHERAGSMNVVHMHGELLRSRCSYCGDVRPCYADLDVAMACPSCDQRGGLRPDVVWFAEAPMEMDRILRAINTADLFVSIGTSGSVYPAAGFVAEARRIGIQTLELNLEPSENAHDFHEGRYGPATKVVAEWADDMMAMA